MRNIIRKVKKLLHKAISGGNKIYIRSSYALSNRSGEGYVDTAVKILMAVVIGALVLGGLYKLFGDTVLPNLKEKIEGMFNYAG